MQSVVNACMFMVQFVACIPCPVLPPPKPNTGYLYALYRVVTSADTTFCYSDQSCTSNYRSYRLASVHDASHTNAKDAILPPTM